MKTLILIRHAKSDWSNAGLSDFDRPLNHRGKQDAPMMGQRLHQRDIQIDFFVSSTARRAMQTTQLLTEAIGYSPDDIIWQPDLYLASPREILHVIHQTEDSCQTLALLAHNPGITTLANYLCPEARIANVPTCGVVILEFDIDSWEALNPPGTLIQFDYPKAS